MLEIALLSFAATSISVSLGLGVGLAIVYWWQGRRDERPRKPIPDIKYRGRSVDWIGMSSFRHRGDAA